MHAVVRLGGLPLIDMAHASHPAPARNLLIGSLHSRALPACPLVHPIKRDRVPHGYQEITTATTAYRSQSPQGIS